jgi:hypothetical protein
MHTLLTKLSEREVKKLMTHSQLSSPRCGVGSCGCVCVVVVVGGATHAGDPQVVSARCVGGWEGEPAACRVLADCFAGFSTRVGSSGI